MPTLSSPASRSASTDGTRVFYTTTESLVSADTDTAVDVYERSGGQTALVMKLHHSLTDGVGGMDIARLLFDDGISAEAAREQWQRLLGLASAGLPFLRINQRAAVPRG